MKITFIFLLILLFIIFCGCKDKQKEVLDTEVESSIPENMDTLSIGDSLINTDTAIVSDIEKLATTPYLDNPRKYFRENNRYSNWDKQDKKEVILGFVTEKDGTNSYVIIKKTSGIKELDDEAIRLVEQMKYDKPATDLDGKPVRIGNMAICVYFPPQ